MCNILQKTNHVSCRESLIDEEALVELGATNENSNWCRYVRKQCDVLGAIKPRDRSDRPHRERESEKCCGMLEARVDRFPESSIDTLSKPAAHARQVPTGECDGWQHRGPTDRCR